MTPDDLQPANSKDVQRATGAVRAQVPGDLPASADGATPAAEGGAKAQSPKSVKGTVIAVVIMLGIAGVSYLIANLVSERFFPAKPKEVEVERPVRAPTLGPRADEAKLAGMGIPDTKPYRDPAEGKEGERADTPEEVKGAKDIYDEIYKRERAHLTNDVDFSLANTDSYQMPDEEDVETDRPEREGVEGTEPALPKDRDEAREALSPKHDAYPEPGRPAREYLVLLRNALNKMDGMKVDLEKCFILLSMYYDPNIDPKVYLGYIQNMASELYGRLTVQGDKGRMPITDPREQVNIVTGFMMHGGGRFKGWDVQEYHPAISGAGTPITQQHYLAQQVFAQGEDVRNASSSTTLNILTLILLRKLAGVGENHFTGNPDDMPVHVPFYGVRLPDRTILRFDAGGHHRPLPEREGGDSSDPLSLYTRNVEFLRNGNHYDGADYDSRFAISDGEKLNGIYLWTLDDRELFASLGYELARMEVFKGQRGDGESWKRARTLLEEWVLDRDDGTQGHHRDGVATRPVSSHRAPRGDLKLRDAHLLYAQMLLLLGDFEHLKMQIDENPALLTDPALSGGLSGMLAHSKGHLESAIAHLEDAIKLSDDNARAHLYLGDISLLMHDGSTPEAMVGTGGDRLHMALRHLNAAETYDNGTLTGTERFLLHYRRALAYARKSEMLDALKDLGRVAKINPEFARTPRYDDLLARFRIERSFQALESPSSKESGELKFEAVAYLEKTLSLKPEHQAELLRCARLFGHTDNVAAEWELAAALGRMTGQNHGRDGAAWETWLRTALKEKR
ncbi:MAG: tetratricopeptide repeat protein [Planctomycetes bacterium]|nr:tetratricopeptide repeat protein [Planctomycetota bacterium]NUQ33527.1 hypothetical protein [Planctomycetaceae bacterium]